MADKEIMHHSSSKGHNRSNRSMGIAPPFSTCERMPMIALRILAIAAKERSTDRVRSDDRQLPE